MPEQGGVSTVRLRILGPLGASVDAGEIVLGGLQQRRLLAMLITETPRVVPVDRLAGRSGPMATSLMGPVAL